MLCRTTGYRKAISCHYTTADCDFINVAGTVQEELGAIRAWSYPHVLTCIYIYIIYIYIYYIYIYIIYIYIYIII
jgi:hypothetical protein